MAIPKPKVGDDARAYSARVRKALVDANVRLKNDGAFYDDMRGHFGHN